MVLTAKKYEIAENNAKEQTITAIDEFFRPALEQQHPAEA
jgi:hypothetical protein